MVKFLYNLRKELLSMKRVISVVLLAMMLCAMFASCTGTTPDQLEAEKKAMTLDELDWSIPIVIEATGETVTYTLAQAEAHELTKTYISAYQFENAQAQGAPQVTTLILEGVKFADVLTEIGVTDFSSITVEHNNMPDLFEFDKEISLGDGTIIGWIQNKTLVVEDSYPTYVAFGSDKGGVHDFCHSIKQITVHP